MDQSLVPAQAQAQSKSSIYFNSVNICLIKDIFSKNDFDNSIYERYLKINNNISKKEFNYIIYLLFKTNPDLQIVRRFVRDKIQENINQIDKNIDIEIKLIQNEYLHLIDLDLFNNKIIIKLFESTYNELFDKIKLIINQLNKSVNQPNDLFYYLIFNVDKIFNLLKNQFDTNTNSYKIFFLELLIKKIENEIIIKIDNCKFILINKIYYNTRFYYYLKSINESDNKINSLIFYSSNSELGFLRWASKNKKGQLEKFSDYATETMIDFRLQKEIYQKQKNITTKNETNESKLNIPDSFSDTNLKLLQIFKEDILESDSNSDSYTSTNKYIQSRRYFNYLFYCFSSLTCGELFKKNSNNYWTQVNNFRDNIMDIYREIKKIKTLPTQIPVQFTEFKIDNKELFTNKIIQINNLDQLKTKVRSMADLAIELQINHDYKSITLHSLTAHYTMIGKFLDLIIDSIIGEELNIYTFDSVIESDIYYYKYIFANTVNKLIVMIDSVIWNIYWIKYLVTVLDTQTNEVTPFESDYTEFYNIVKIIPVISHELSNKIYESGLDNGFILAGSLQCKPIEYIGQLTGVLSKLDLDSKNKPTEESIEILAESDSNVLNTQYYFIGNYVNLIFTNFNKYNDYIKKKSEKIELSKELLNKYIKYKNKYLNLKK